MWKDYFGFSRREQKGLFLLILITVLLVFFRIIFPLFNPSNNTIVKLDSLYFINSEKNVFTTTKSNSGIYDISQFDPNIVTFDFLTGIGINERIAKNWNTYLQKGGFFQTPEDIMKIYGVDSVLLFQLMPYMKIIKPVAITLYEKEDKKTDHLIDLNRADSLFLTSIKWSNTMIDTLLKWQNEYWIPQFFKQSTLSKWNIDSLYTLKYFANPRYSSKSCKFDFVIEINKADTSELTLLKGIGPALSRRIVNYRNKLGGFISLDQLLEIYGIMVDVIENNADNISIDTSLIVPLNINTASIRRLRDHPYLDFYKAQEIVEKRKIKPFNNIEELLALKSFTDADWNKVRHYLSTEKK